MSVDCLPDACPGLTVITPATLPEALLTTACALGWAHDSGKPLHLIWRVETPLPQLFDLPENKLELLPAAGPAGQVLSRYLSNRAEMPKEMRREIERHFDYLLVRDTLHEQARLREILAPSASVPSPLGRMLVHQSGLFYRKPRFDDFAPSLKIASRLKRLNADHPLPDMIGVYLHAADGALQARELAAVETLLAVAPSRRCFLVANHPQACQPLHHTFGRRVVELKRAAGLNLLETSALNLFALAGAQQVYGSSGGSAADFGRLAAALGGRPFKPLTAPDTRPYHIADEQLPELWRHWAYWPA